MIKLKMVRVQILAYFNWKKLNRPAFLFLLWKSLGGVHNLRWQDFAYYWLPPVHISFFVPTYTLKIIPCICVKLLTFMYWLIYDDWKDLCQILQKQIEIKNYFFGNISA